MEKLTSNPFLKVGKSFQYFDGVISPDPAPRTIAREVTMIIINKKILINDDTYSNHAKILLGRRKMDRDTNKKIVTVGQLVL